MTFFFGGGQKYSEPSYIFSRGQNSSNPQYLRPWLQLTCSCVKQRLQRRRDGDSTAARLPCAPSGNCTEVVRWSCASRNRVAVVKRRIRAAGQTLSVYTQVDRLYRCQQLASPKLRQSTCVPLHSGDGSRGGCRRKTRSSRVASRVVTAWLLPDYETKSSSKTHSRLISSHTKNKKLS